MISDYLLFFVLIFATVLSIYFAGLLYQRIELLKLTAISMGFLFAGYVVCSGIYFWLDQFQFIRVLATECMCFSIGIAALMIKNKTLLFAVERKSRSMWIYILMFCGFLISAQKFTFYGMDQDEGVYQTKAIALAYGYTQRQFDFPEFQLLETDEQRDVYLHAVKGLGGYDLYDVNKPTLSINEKMSPVSAIFHGIPTFPAVLGLTIKIFGIASMQSVQSIFLICSLLFVLFAVENLSLKKSSQFLSLGIVAFSPIVQWVMKSALTEGYLVLIFAWFIYLITDQEYSISRLLSAVPILAFSFWHLTIFTIMPLFVFLYIVAYQETNNKQYIYVGILSIVFFEIGNIMMMYVAPTYTSNNISNNFNGFLANSKIIPTFLVASILTVVFLCLINRIHFNIVYRWIKHEHIFAWILRGIMLLSFAAIFQYAYGLTAIYRLTILVYIFGTGTVVLPLCFLIIFCFPSKMLRDKRYLFITAMFFYCVILMAAFLRKEVVYTYYYSRYLAPFIVICGITAGVITSMLPSKLTLAVLACSLAFLLPYDWVLLKQEDDSRMEWNVLVELADNITEDSAVILDTQGSTTATSIHKILMLPIKTMTGADVYPVIEDTEAQIKFLRSNYNSVFRITTDPAYDKGNIHSRVEPVYLNQYTISEDRGSGRRAWGSQFPLEFTVIPQKISMFRYRTDELEYDFSKNIACSGFDVVERAEKNDFRWICSNNATLEVILSKRDYVMSVEIGVYIPLNELGRNDIEINVNLNGYCLKTYYVTKENMDQDIQIMIPKQYLEDGKNTITFCGKPWSPSEFGSADSRKLLLPISKITFEEANFSLYDLGEKELFDFSGFSLNEGGFRWSNASPAEIKFFADNQNDYQCSIVQGAPLPMEALGMESYEGRIVINENEAAAIKFALQPEQEDIAFEIDKELLADGVNTIQIYAPLWSPSDYGLDDTRKLGISIDKIIFTPRG